MQVISFGGKVPGTQQAANGVKKGTQKAMAGLQSGLKKPLEKDTLNLSHKAAKPTKK